jgi:group I intron endonuclease
MFVYLIQNTVNGKCYVGQHSGDDLAWYFRENIASAMRGSTGKRLLYRAIRKHGPESFNIRPIYIAVDKQDMDDAEIAYIKFFGTRDVNLGYNLTDGGDGVLGLVFSEETLEKMRQATLARGGISYKCREAQKEYLKTRVFSDEHRRKLSEARKRNKISDETKAKMSASRKGVTLSRETIDKIVAARKGYIHSDETREKIRKAAFVQWERKRAEVINAT